MLAAYQTREGYNCRAARDVIFRRRKPAMDRTQEALAGGSVANQTRTQRDLLMQYLDGFLR